jgi:autotransporter strand-loop-strand O-heptosyltransferase
MKYLFITGHLSTGGAPKYLEWLIKEKAKEGALIKVIEWNLYSEEYNIQRNEIIKFVGEQNFINIGRYDEPAEIFKEKENKAIDLINRYQPDFIHLNDFSEQFALQGMSERFVSFLYDKERRYKIYETLHDSLFDIKNKKNMPDEFWFCSDFHEEAAKSLNYNYKVVEMQIEKKTRPDRKETLSSLGLNPDFYHVLQVGLICANKNQKFTADLAKQFLDKPVQFHFVGNLCFLNECGIDVNQKNCKFWGERSDVDKFLSCMDLFVMPSFRELNPISVKEALAWDMKCFVSNLEIFHKKYSGNDNISIISGTNLQEHISNSLNKNKKRFITNFSLDTNDILVSYNPSPRVDIIGDQVCNYDVKFIDQKDGSVKHQSRITNNMWTSCFIRYYVDWKILITNLIDDSEIVFFMDLKGKTVKISNESPSLGDTIAWMPVVDAFQKKHNCVVDFYTAKKDLLQNQYLNINFYDYSANNNKDYYCEYKLGCFLQKDRSYDKTDWQNLSLQEIACSILDVEKPQSRTKLKVNHSFRFLNHKYVCIATQSTSQSRYWNNKDGWKQLIDYLHSLGYKVVCVDKERYFGVQNSMNSCPENIDYFVGSLSFNDVINIINKADFFIGLSSGLSWISWALNKKIVLISGSVSENFEFYTPYRVINKNVCNGCFDSLKYSFNPSDWKWCPANKDYECTKQITFDMIKEVVDDLIDGLNKKKKIKIAHLQTTVNSESEVKSRTVLQSFNYANIKYSLNVNEPYCGDDYKNNCLYPALISTGVNDKRPDKLTDKHYGCFTSHKNAFIKEFDDDVDFLMICEGDVKLEVPNDIFYDTIIRVANIMEREDIAYFSFGDKYALESKVLQSNEISTPKNQALCYITDKIIGIQCVMFNKKYRDIFKNSFMNNPWYVADGWYNDVVFKNELKIAILKNRITSQYDGFSLIDNKIKNF